MLSLFDKSPIFSGLVSVPALAALVLSFMADFMAGLRLPAILVLIAFGGIMWVSSNHDLMTDALRRSMTDAKKEDAKITAACDRVDDLGLHSCYIAFALVGLAIVIPLIF